MSSTSIEWTDKSWNPVAAYFNGKRGWMCSKPSPGCKHCYSERINLRLGNGLLYTAENAARVDWQLVNLDEPAKWRKPQMCFVESMGDLFHEAIPDEMIGRVWSQMLEFPRHTFQVLTKRPKRMRVLLEQFRAEKAAKGVRDDDHIWLGVSVENQEQADKRIPELLGIPAAVRFLSCEPLLGAIDLYSIVAPDGDGPNSNLYWIGMDASIDWVIVGGESGPGARPMHPEWARSLRDQCQNAGVPFFFKQWGEWKPSSHPEDFFPVGHRRQGMPRYPNRWIGGDTHLVQVGKKASGRLLDGREWNEFPKMEGA